MTVKQVFISKDKTNGNYFYTVLKTSEEDSDKNKLQYVIILIDRKTFKVCHIFNNENSYKKLFEKQNNTINKIGNNITEYIKSIAENDELKVEIKREKASTENEVEKEINEYNHDVEVYYISEFLKKLTNSEKGKYVHKSLSTTTAGNTENENTFMIIDYFDVDWSIKSLPIVYAVGHSFQIKNHNGPWGTEYSFFVGTEYSRMDLDTFAEIEFNKNKGNKYLNYEEESTTENLGKALSEQYITMTEQLGNSDLYKKISEKEEQ